MKLKWRLPGMFHAGTRGVLWTLKKTGVISHGSVKMRSMNEVTAGWQSSPEAMQGVILIFFFLLSM
jgi:hypothetical protein